MSRSRPNPRLAKIHRNYSVDEIAKVFGVHRNTVRAWLKAGLPSIDDRRPTLIHGSALVEFLSRRRASNRRPCRPGEIYCVRCHEPRAPAGGVVEYRVMTPTGGNLVGTCPDCHAGLYRRVAASRLGAALGELRIQGAEALEHIAEPDSRLVD